MIVCSIRSSQMLWLGALLLLRQVASLNVLISSSIRTIKVGYMQRVEADPTFPLKSAAEVMLAAGTQIAAECRVRGVSNLAPQIDFVVAGVLTAIAGKYYSMWKVAMTQENASAANSNENIREARLFNLPVPTNAFQTTMLDGVTRPTSLQRVASILAAMFPLFRAGILASMIGYGLCALLIVLRTTCIPNYQAATQNVNVVYASLYTGAFMALVSNTRYQLLQGVVEPSVCKFFNKRPRACMAILFFFRWMNGILGSMLAILGMRSLGLQRLK